MDNWLLPFKADFSRPKIGYDSRAVMLTPPGDHLAHTIQISCYDGDGPVDVTAYTAAGHFRRRDGNVVLVEDTVNISANVVTLVLPQECYAYPGAMHGIVRLTNAQTGGKVTILDTWFIVPESVDGGTIDPGEVIPSIDDLLAQIEAMEEATAEAEDAATLLAPTVAEIKESLSVLNTVDAEWRNGSINTSNGEDTSSTKRIRTLLRNYKHGIKVVLPEGMEASIRIYSAAGVYEGWEDWASGTIEISLTEEKGYRFVARYSDESTISTSAGAEITIYEVDYMDVLLRTSGKAADAKATGDMFAALGIVPYWANGYKSNSGGEMRQENSIITINGYNGGSSFRVALSGAFNVGVANTVFTEAPDTILLRAGHTYKMKVEYISGSYSEDEDGRFEVSFGIYQGAGFEPVTPRAALVEGVDIDWKTYTPSVTGLYKIGMMIYRKVTYTDYKVRAVLTDITEWVSA